MKMRKKLVIVGLIAGVCRGAAPGWREQAAKFFHRPRSIAWQTPGEETYLEVSSIGQHKHRSHDFQVIVNEDSAGLTPGENESLFDAAAALWWNDKLSFGRLAITGRKDRSSNGQDMHYFFVTDGRAGFSICDGHGPKGGEVAEAVCREFERQVRNPRQLPERLLKGTAEGLRFHHDLVSWLSRGASSAYEVAHAIHQSGSTATALNVFAMDDDGRRVAKATENSPLLLTALNLGDTRAVVYQFDGVTSRTPRPSDHFTMKRLTDEHCYTNSNEVLYAEQQLLRAGLYVVGTALVRGMLGGTRMELYGSDEAAGHLKALWEGNQVREYRSTALAVEDLLKAANKLEQEIWSITRHPTLGGGQRAALTLFHRSGTMLELTPSGSFGDQWMKTAQRKFPSVVRGARLLPSTTASTLVVAASDGVWETLDKVNSRPDMQGSNDLLVADLLSKAVAAADGSLSAGLQALYSHVRSLGSRDDITIEAIWFSRYEVSPIVPTVRLPFNKQDVPWVLLPDVALPRDQAAAAGENNGASSSSSSGGEGSTSSSASASEESEPGVPREIAAHRF